MPHVGHSTTVKVSGAAVPVVAEATTSLSALIFQITTAARRIVDPNTAIVVYDGGVPVAATAYTFNYLFGKVTFLAPPGGAVTIDCSYLPVAAIAEVKSIEINVDAGLADKTSFDSAGVRRKMATLLETSGSFTMLSLPLDDIDPVTGGVQTLAAVLVGGTPKLLETVIGGYYIRHWAKLSNIKVGAAVEDLVESTVEFAGDAQKLGAVFEISLP